MSRRKSSTLSCGPKRCWRPVTPSAQYRVRSQSEIRRQHGESNFFEAPAFVLCKATFDVDFCNEVPGPEMLQVICSETHRLCSFLTLTRDMTASPTAQRNGCFERGSSSA